MKVAEVMSGAVEFIEGSAFVLEAVKLMGDLNVGALPIGSAEAFEGIVTDRDVLFRVVAEGRDPTTTRVRDIKSPDMKTRWEIVSCRGTDELLVAMDLMAAAEVRRMPVLDVGGKVVGWVTLADIARKLVIDSRTLQRGLIEITEVGSETAA